MALVREHEMHKRRKSRNIGLGGVLILFVTLVFGLTIAKVSPLMNEVTAQGETTQ
jgi:hypothetical protein